MKRLTVSGITALALIGLGAASVPGTANAGFLSHERAQDREIRRLSGQIGTLQAQVRNLQHEVFVCEFYDSSTPTLFSGGSTGYPEYRDSAC